MNPRHLRGLRAESKALAWLKSKGLALIRQNYQCRYGELDLIMLDDDTVVAVEVRSRQTSQFLQPSLSVDHRKQGKLIRSAEYFLQANPAYAGNAVRFDVVAIINNGRSEIKWLRDAFRVD
ncbi:MAG: YraN family protein [Gammaproteobacteria bacterium]|nr:YraN family protein [Gammaproteobacteria bacterium]